MTRWILLIVSVAGLLALGVVIRGRMIEVETARAAQRPADERPPAVAVAPVTAHDYPHVLTVTGDIHPKRRVAAMPRIPARVVSIAVEVGDTVIAKQPLAVLEDAELQLRLNQAEAAKAAAKTAVAAAKVRVEAADLELKRARRLQKDHAIPKAQYDRAVMAARGARAGVKAARAQVKVAAAAVALAHEASTWNVIKAPIGGVITARRVEIGSMAAPTQPAFEVQQLDPLTVVAAVPPEHLDAVARGQAVTIHSDARPQTTYHGVIRRVDPTLDARSRRARVEIDLVGDQAGLRANMFVSASIDLGTNKAVPSAPRRAVMRREGRNAIYALIAGKTRLVFVDLAAADADFVPVGPSLALGAEVIVRGQSDLAPDSPVRVVPFDNDSRPAAEAPLSQPTASQPTPSQPSPSQPSPSQPSPSQPVAP